MEHPNGKVAGASHSVFSAFMTLGKESEIKDRVSLKEQLVFHYIQRSLLVFEFDSLNDFSFKSETDNLEFFYIINLICI